MNHLLAIAVQNTIVAGLLAVLVYGLTRVWRRPPVAHILWLLVLAKLIGPPILPTDWLRPGSRDPLHDPHNGARELPVGPQAAFTAVAHPSVGHEPAADAAARRDSDTEPIASSNEAAAVGRWTELFEIGTEYVQLYSDELREGVLFMWLAGLAVCGSITLYRVLRFDRMLRGTLVAPQKSQAIAAQLAQKLQLRRVPDLRLAEGCSVPLVWCFGRRPIVVLPTRLVRELDDQQTAMVLAHELAHLRRRDHWIRVAEIVIATAYWWNPLVWWVRRQLHQVEELCCDAWVDWIYPDTRKRYAEVLFQAATLVRATPCTPSLACSFLSAAPLKNRIETLLEGHLSRHVSRKTALALAGVAALLLPSFAHSARPAETGSSLGTGESATKSALRGKVVGTVTVEGTGEPVKDATIAVTLGTFTGREYDRLAAKTDANGHYSIDVPLGNVAFWPWFLRFPPGYWVTDGRANVVTSTAAPVATKDFALRRGAVWRVCARDTATRQPIPAIQCTARSLEGPTQMPVAFTNSDGIAQVTLPGFHGRFQIVVFDPNHRGRFQLASVLLRGESGFHVDRGAEISAGKEAGTYALKDKEGKAATVQGARVMRVDGRVLLDVDLVPTASGPTSGVRGTVADESGQPIAGARVEAAQGNADGTGFITGMAATTGPNGRFEIANPGIRSGGKVSLVVTRTGYAGIETPPQSIPENNETPLDCGRITLLPGKTVRVRVLDAAGHAVVGAWVEPRGSYAVIVQSGATDEQGECVLRNLPKGLVKVYVTFGDFYANGTAVAVDNPRTITLHLKPFPKRSPSTEQNQPRPLALGTPAPDLAVAEWSDGKTRSLADYRGKVVVLDFWGIWCGPCVQMLPVIKSLEAKYKDRDVAFVMIHTAGTEMEQIQEFERQMKFDQPTALDAGNDVNEGATTKRYAVGGYPTVFIIGRDGRIAWCNIDRPRKTHTQNMKRAAQALSIPWPFDEKQPHEKLVAQMNRIREFLFSEAINQALAKP